MGIQHADIWFSDDSFNDIHLCRRYSLSCLPRVRSTCHWLVIMSHHLSQLSNMKQNAASCSRTIVSNQRAG